MQVSLEERIAALKEIIITLSLYAVFGSVLLILGLYIKFTENRIFFIC